MSHPNLFKGKVILVTGGTGSIGSVLVKKLLACGPKSVRVLSRDESMQSELLERFQYPKNLRVLIGDIRDLERISYAFKGVDIVFHAAALKHVPLCEYNPFEAIKTNVIGSQNVVDAAIANKVKKVIAISTDKAVYPSNVMGTSKLMMEKLFLNANYYSGKSDTKFSCVRFGNVAWARGSVLPIWRQQAETKKLITVTDPSMTRFLMSLDQAVGLVMDAAILTQGAEIFILKMNSISVGDLARLFVKKYYPDSEVEITVIGKRSGDKLHEELLDDNDLASQMFENKKMFIVVPIPNIHNYPNQKRVYAGFSPVKKRERFSSKDYLHKTNVGESI